MKYEITGSDITQLEPVNGVIHVAGIVKTPDQLVNITWEVDNSSGATICQAWRVQYEIDCLVRAGYNVLSVGLYVPL